MLSLPWFLLVLLAAPHVASINVTNDLKVAFYISLDRMPTRREAMESQLKSADLHAQRWRAISWENVSNGDYDNDYVKRQGVSPDLEAMIGDEKTAEEAFGTIACFLSHVTALVEASKKLKPHDIALIMEDDVSIPEDWKKQLQSVVDKAPSDWDLIKLSGFGAHRLADLVNISEVNSSQKENLPVPSLTGNLAGALGTAAKIALPTWATDALMKSQTDSTSPTTYWMMNGPFKEPAFMNLGTQGPGSPNIFYGGAGAYVVRGLYIHKVINRLRSKPIDDVDSMMLIDGTTDNSTTHSYDIWPHIFELAAIAMHGPGLHTRFAHDEGNAAVDHAESEGQMRPGVRGKSHAFLGPPLHESEEIHGQVKRYPFDSPSSIRLVLYVGGVIVMTLAIICSIQVCIRRGRARQPK